MEVISSLMGVPASEHDERPEGLPSSPWSLYTERQVQGMQQHNVHLAAVQGPGPNNPSKYILLLQPEAPNIGYLDPLGVQRPIKTTCVLFELFRIEIEKPKPQTQTTCDPDQKSFQSKEAVSKESNVFSSFLNSI